MPPAKGKWRGGIGSVREFTFLSDGAFSVEGEGHKYRPWGFSGGERGFDRFLVACARRGRRDEMPSKVPYRGADAADRLLALGPNGGGYGDPFERDPEAVLSDMLDGYISTEQARADYGVVIIGKAVDDRRRRGALRARVRRARRGRRASPCARSKSRLPAATNNLRIIEAPAPAPRSRRGPRRRRLLRLQFRRHDDRQGHVSASERLSDHRRPRDLGSGGRARARRRRRQRRRPGRGLLGGGGRLRRPVRRARRAPRPDPGRHGRSTSRRRSPSRG